MNLVLTSTADFYGPVTFAWFIEAQSRSDILVIIPLLLKHLMPAGHYKITQLKSDTSMVWKLSH